MKSFLHSFLGYYCTFFMCVSWVDTLWDVLSSILTKGEPKNIVLDVTFKKIPLDALRKCSWNIWPLKTKDHTESKSEEPFYTSWLKDFQGTQRQSWAVQQGESLLTVHCTVGTRWCSSSPFPGKHSSILTTFIQHLTRPSLCHGCICGQCHSDTTSG